MKIIAEIEYEDNDMMPHIHTTFFEYSSVEELYSFLKTKCEEYMKNNDEKTYPYYKSHCCDNHFLFVGNRKIYYFALIKENINDYPHYHYVAPKLFTIEDWIKEKDGSDDVMSVVGYY